MALIKEFYIGIIPPAQNNVGWLKPVDNGFALYLSYDGRWRLAKLVDDKGTDNPDDDTEFSITSGTTNGSIAVDGVDIPITGLGSAAFTNSDAYDASGSAQTAKSEILGDAAAAYNTLGKVEDKLINDDTLIADNRLLAVLLSFANRDSVSTISEVTNPEWKVVLTDSEDKILMGIKVDETVEMPATYDEIVDCIIASYEANS